MKNNNNENVIGIPAYLFFMLKFIYTLININYYSSLTMLKLSLDSISPFSLMPDDMILSLNALI